MTEENKQQRLWRQGEQYAVQGQWVSALRCFQSIIAHDPGHVKAWLRASRTQLSLGRYRDGLSSALRALSLDPADDEDVLVLARSLRTFNEPDALRQCLAKSNFTQRTSAAWLTEMAMLISTIGDNQSANELLDVALQRDPLHAPAHYFRGVVEMFFGRVESSEHSLERCIALQPSFAQAHWVLSRLRKLTEQDNHVDRMAAQIVRASPGREGEAYFAFALHNELHDLKRYAESWQALERGCRVKRKLTPFDRTESQRMYEGLRGLCDTDFIARTTDVSGEYIPIFIVGMHRSGSTLLEQLIGGHPQVSDGGETYSFTTQMRYAADYRSRGPLDAEMVRRAKGVDYSLIATRFFESTQWRARGKAFLTEKLPSNFLNAGFIAKAMPTARILHMVRDPLDTCFSNLRTMFSDVNAFSYDQTELVEYFGRHRQLMSHWHQVMPGRVLDVAYDQLVADPAGVMSGVLKFCGLPWDDGVSRLDERQGAVATASSPQVRGGIMKGRSAAWQPYRENLTVLIDGLADYR